MPYLTALFVHTLAAYTEVNMSIFYNMNQSNNANFDASPYSDMLYGARNSETSAIGKQRGNIERHVFWHGKGGDYSHDEVVDTVNNFSREFFSRLYEDSDRIDDRSLDWQASAHDICDQLSEFDQLKNMCMDQPEYSALATSHFLRDMTEQLADLITADLDPDSVDYDDAIEDFRSSFRKSMQDAADNVGTTKKLVQSLDVGKEKSGNVLNRQELIADLSANKELQAIIEKAGRLIDVMNSLPVKSEALTEDIVSVKLGRDIKHATNQSICYLADPDTSDMFYAKWVAHELELMEFQGTEPLGRGPVRILVDVSGSMRCDLAGRRWDNHHFDGVSRNRWAKSTAIAMATTAVQKKRPVIVQTFTVNIESCWDSTGPKYSHDAMISELSREVTEWGTSFETLLEDVLPELKEKEDILLITDGEDNISQKTIDLVESYKKKGLRIYTILITGDPSKAVESISDFYINLTELIDEDDITKSIAVTMDMVS